MNTSPGEAMPERTAFILSWTTRNRLLAVVLGFAAISQSLIFCFCVFASGHCRRCCSLPRAGHHGRCSHRFQTTATAARHRRWCVNAGGKTSAQTGAHDGSCEDNSSRTSDRSCEKSSRRSSNGSCEENSCRASPATRRYNHAQSYRGRQR